jgi:hypothetical protein
LFRIQKGQLIYRGLKARLEVLTPMKIQVVVSWVVTPFNVVVGYKNILEDLAASIS